MPKRSFFCANLVKRVVVVLVKKVVSLIEHYIVFQKSFFSYIFTTIVPCHTGTQAQNSAITEKGCIKNLTHHIYTNRWRIYIQVQVVKRQV